MKYPFKPINTGQKWPVGIQLHKGRCPQCGRKDQMAAIRLEVPGLTKDLPDICVECFADFLAAPIGKVYALNLDGKYQLVGIDWGHK